MSRHTIFNIALAFVVLGLVGAVVYLESTNDDDGGAAVVMTTTTLAPTTLPPTTLEPTTLAPTTFDPTTVVPPTLETTTVPTTEAPTTLPPTTLPPPERPFVPVVVTSAGSNGERVGPTVFLLASGGWADIRGLNGAVPVTATTIYFIDGFQNAAELMAADMTLPVTSVAPIAAAPPIAGLGNAALVVYLGG